MKKEYLEQLSLCELFDLLAKHTLNLLNSIQERADASDIKDLKNRVELIQELIKQKKFEPGNNSS